MKKKSLTNELRKMQKFCKNFMILSQKLKVESQAPQRMRLTAECRSMSKKRLVSMHLLPSEFRRVMLFPVFHENFKV
uniref:Uncharacterized protein n=1 Tax=virus sp. ctkyY8 TaxID=2827995 RepID=A0A8S5RDP0_9VIRU|nr:MAG TPA: hypothetical protein [virus sp. ctkyY8]